MPLSPTTDPPSPYVNPEVAHQGRRLTPACIDGILRGHAAGVPHAVLSRAYSVSPTTVSRVVERSDSDPRLAPDASALSELADAERELRENVPPGRALEDLISLVRAGHLLRRDRERRTS